MRSRGDFRWFQWGMDTTVVPRQVVWPVKCLCIEADRRHSGRGVGSNGDVVITLFNRIARQPSD